VAIFAFNASAESVTDPDTLFFGCRLSDFDQPAKCMVVAGDESITFASRSPARTSPCSMGPIGRIQHGYSRDCRKQRT
jgi:hypothetical protein